VDDKQKNTGNPLQQDSHFERTTEIRITSIIMSFRRLVQAVMPDRRAAATLLCELMLVAMVMQVCAEPQAPKHSVKEALSPGATIDKAKALDPTVPTEPTLEIPPPQKSAALVLIERILQALAIASNIAFHLSPMRIILEIRRYKDTRGTDGLPYLMIFWVATSWCVYGTFAMVATGNMGLQMILFGNATGVIMGFFYVYSFHKNCNDQIRANKMKVFYRVAATVFIAENVMICTLPTSMAIFSLGLIASILSVGCTAAPLTELSVVLKSRDTSIWPTDFIYVNSVGLIIWLICGVLLNDTWVIVPNAIGTGICMFQLGVIAVFNSEQVNKLKKIRKEEMTFHVIDETAPIVMPGKGKWKNEYNIQGEDLAPLTSTGAKVMW